MLISALCDYCDALEQKGKLPPEGYAEIGISYLIELNIDGSLAGIIDIREKTEEIIKGKTKTSYKPKNCLFPERRRSTSILTNFVEVRGSYIFGLEFRKDKESKKEFLSTEADEKTEEKKKKLFKQHQNFSAEVQEDFGLIEKSSELVKAYIGFADNWYPEKETANRRLLELGKDLNTAKFAFCLAGHPEKMLQDDTGVIERWKYINRETESDEKCQCAVTGEYLPVARVHDALVNIKNAGINPTLVNFKPEAFMSYGHEQGTNACISIVAMKKYTKALNWLLSSPEHHSYLDGLTLVYWAQDAEESEYDPMRMLLGDYTNQAGADEMDNNLSVLAVDAKDANISKRRIRDIEKSVSPDTDYYVLALAPNSSRIQVKFIYRQKLGRVIENIARYQSDIRISGQKKQTVPLWALKKELVSPKSSHPEQLDSIFISALKSIIAGNDYPNWLLSTVVRRIRKDRGSSDQDNQKISYKRINYIRAGIVKACIMRHTKEEIKVSLDRENTNPAYLCGRLFAVLQKIQEDSAAPQKLNRSIEDAYFGSASANPAAVMPKLVKLSQHHMARLKRIHPDWAVNDSKMFNEIISKLGTSFPGTLGLYDQGRFILGYYQQNAVRYEAKKGEV